VVGTADGVVWFSVEACEENAVDASCASSPPDKRVKEGKKKA
jgi:hypothetical protein